VVTCYAGYCCIAKTHATFCLTSLSLKTSCLDTYKTKTGKKKETPCLNHVSTSRHTMGNTRRESALTKSIQSGLLREPDKCKKTAWRRFLAFFTVRRIRLVRYELELFVRLRKEIWKFDEDEYKASFRTSAQPPLKMIGDMGYSGSVSGPRYNCKDIILTNCS
jgi:hypothetical protein